MSTQQNGLVSGNSQNQAGGASIRSRSTFPLSYSFFKTERFAEYTPFYVQEGVSTDRLPLHSNHEVQTYTLKSPILQSLAKKKDYFMVPMQAILPLNWEKFYTNPNIGEDVPEDTGCGVQNFWAKVKTLFTSSVSVLTSSDEPEDNDDLFSILSNVFRFLIFFEQFYSAGSLLENLGISGHNWFRAVDAEGNDVMFDEIFDWVLSKVSSYVASNDLYFRIGSDQYRIVGSPINGDRNHITVSLREMLEIMRDDNTGAFYGTEEVVDEDDGISPLLGKLVSDIMDYFNNSISFLLPSSDAPLNVARLWAYQLVCAHYYSNDHVDFIYSAELYRQYVFDLVLNGDFSLSESFTVNSLSYPYDALSAHYLDVALTTLSSFDPLLIFDPDASPWIAYFTAMLSFKRSLRFMDYFTGARTRPLAVGDTAVDVVNGKVDIIDLSKRSMAAKFLQAVGRSGRKFGAYMQELFNKVPAYDYHNPMYLAHTSDLVGVQETENTGAAQVDPDRSIAITSRFRASSSRYAFEFIPDRDAVVIGLTYYDLPRVYLRATERQAFILNRFDYFNPYLQFTGDQPIWQAEIGTDTPTYGDPTNDVPFGYQNRDMQWKQRFNQACGGFCIPSTGLDNWIFPADTLRRNRLHRVSPSFIRSFNSEVDRFYQSLSGWSLGTYFHFIVRYDNRMDASRPMAYAPTITV